ncbi:MAG: CoA pyrophosphatase [Proteobacteria bacterium]|nr:CoA pyrophosphatase [Pseudomonadota bacterium]MBS0573975.1 CoA pyrophosphatase [Pseudomonadota bacterium]
MPAPDALAALRRALARPGRDTSDHDLNPRVAAAGQAPGQALRPAAVLLGFRPGPAGTSLILTKRASHLKHHPGQIAFPGGKLDRGDRDATAAALREAQEEIGLAPSQARILGALPAHETVTGFCVTPVLAEIDPDFCPVADAGEVEEVFSVPFAHVADPAHFHIESRIWRGHLRRYYTVPYGPYYIWGATARILRALADRMAS